MGGEKLRAYRSLWNLHLCGGNEMKKSDLEEKWAWEWKIPRVSAPFRGRIACRFDYSSCTWEGFSDLAVGKWHDNRQWLTGLGKSIPLNSWKWQDRASIKENTSGGGKKLTRARKIVKGNRFCPCLQSVTDSCPERSFFNIPI